MKWTATSIKIENVVMVLNPSELIQVNLDFAEYMYFCAKELRSYAARF